MQALGRRRTLFGRERPERLPITAFKQRDVQKRFGALLVAKMAGVVASGAAVLTGLYLIGGVVGAEPVPLEDLTGIVNPLNTMWVLVAAFLVFFMQAGFMALEAGFARSKETVNVMMECMFDTCLCGILYWAVGFAFEFGTGGSLIGQSYFFLHDITPTYDYGGAFDTGVAFYAFVLFQFAFADTASTITSGAMVGRTSFKGDILYSLAVSGLIYPITCHWVWGPGGWLNSGTMGWFGGVTKDGLFFRDFAGSTAVHTVGGGIALIGAIALGPRIGRTFARDGGGPLPPHDVNIAAIGAVLLWFGWYGFNPGSTLSIIDMEGVARVAINTTFAASAGGLVCVFWGYVKTGKWDVGLTINGFLGGLVAITAPCYWVQPSAAVLIGALAGIVVPLATDLLEHLRIDDPVGAVPVHLACGIWGTLAIGLFADGDLTDGAVDGLFYGGGVSQLWIQIIGNVSCLVFVLAASCILMFGLRRVPGSWNLRLDREAELEGIDIYLHGIPAYHMEVGQGLIHTTQTSG